MLANASRKAMGRPVTWDTHWAKCTNQSLLSAILLFLYMSRRAAERPLTWDPHCAKCTNQSLLSAILLFLYMSRRAAEVLRIITRLSPHRPHPSRQSRRRQSSPAYAQAAGP